MYINTDDLLPLMVSYPTYLKHNERLIMPHLRARGAEYTVISRWLGGVWFSWALVEKVWHLHNSPSFVPHTLRSSPRRCRTEGRVDWWNESQPKQHGTSLKMRHQLVEPLPHQPFLPQKKTIEGSMFSGGSASQTRRILTCLKRPVFNRSRGTFFQVTYTSEIWPHLKSKL